MCIRDSLQRYDPCGTALDLCILSRCIAVSGLDVRRADKWLSLIHISQAGKNYGVTSILVGTGYGKELYEASRAKKDEAPSYDYYACLLYTS